MLFGKVLVRISPKCDLTDAEIDKLADIVELAAWEAVESDLQERLEIAFPGRFTVKLEVD